MKFVILSLLALSLSGFASTASFAQGQQSIAIGEDVPRKKKSRRGSKGNSPQEQELARQAKAFQRTMAEAIGTGAAIGLGVDLATGNRNGNGISIGIGAGALTGSYVARLQKKYRRKEKRLERVRDDITKANAELAASIATMQAVVAFQQSELAALKASGAKKRKIRKELKDAKANLDNMQKAIKGAKKWEKEFKSTRSLRLVKGQATGVDNQLSQLSARIAAMRQVAQEMKKVSKS